MSTCFERNPLFAFSYGYAQKRGVCSDSYLMILQLPIYFKEYKFWLALEDYKLFINFSKKMCLLISEYFLELNQKI